jgi:hypothetical protein
MPATAWWVTQVRGYQLPLWKVVRAQATLAGVGPPARWRFRSRMRRSSSVSWIPKPPT